MITGSGAAACHSQQHPRRDCLHEWNDAEYSTEVCSHLYIYNIYLVGTGAAQKWKCLCRGRFVVLFTQRDEDLKD
jgi:hypothetical protein